MDFCLGVAGLIYHDKEEQTAISATVESIDKKLATSYSLTS